MQLFKDLYTTNAISATPYGLGELLVNVYGNSTSAVMGEVLIQTLAHASLDNFTVDPNGIVNALYYLNARVESIRKTITTWDAYQIKGTLQDRDTVLAQLAQLPANSSVISNIAEPFQWMNGDQQVTVHKGDVLLKDSNENIVHIPTLSSGYYAPINATTSGNNVVINYHYFTDTPQTDPDDPSSRKPNTPYETMPINIQMAAEVSGYDYFGTLSPGDTKTFSYTTCSGIKIEPIVKFFSIDGEQVFLEQQYIRGGYNQTVEIQLNQLICETNTPSFSYYIAQSAVSSKTSSNDYILINNLTFSRALGLNTLVDSNTVFTCSDTNFSFTLSSQNIKISNSNFAGKSLANTCSWLRDPNNVPDSVFLTVKLVQSIEDNTFTLINDSNMLLYYEVK